MILTFNIKYIKKCGLYHMFFVMEKDQAIVQPRVSVIMPAYNRDATIHAALGSALQQNYPNMEFVVVNDGSQDDTQKIVETFQQQDPRIVLVNNSSNFWISRSRNIGMEHSTWDIFAVLDSDDIRFKKDKIDTQVRFLWEHPNVGILWTNAIVKNKGKYSYTKERLTDRDIRANSIRGTQFVHSTMMYPKQVCETIGGYNPKIKYADDREFQLRAGKYFEFANLPEYTLLYNAHDNNVSHQHRDRQLMESMRLSLRYSPYYPNACVWITKKLLGGAYQITTKALDTLIPWSKDRIKMMIRGKQGMPWDLPIHMNRDIE